MLQLNSNSSRLRDTQTTSQKNFWSQ